MSGVSAGNVTSATRCGAYRRSSTPVPNLRHQPQAALLWQAHAALPAHVPRVNTGGRTKAKSAVNSVTL